MALGKPGLVRSQDHGNVGKFRQRVSEGFVEEDLAGGVVHMVVPPDDMGDVHERVIHHGAEVISRPAVAAQDDQIVQLFVVEFDRSFDQVAKDGDALLRGLEADGGRSIWNRAFQVSAMAVVFGLSFFLQRVLPSFLQLLRSAVAGVGLPFLQEPVHMLAV